MRQAAQFPSLLRGILSAPLSSFLLIAHLFSSSLLVFKAHAQRSLDWFWFSLILPVASNLSNSFTAMFFHGIC